MQKETGGAEINWKKKTQLGLAWMSLTRYIGVSKKGKNLA